MSGQYRPQVIIPTEKDASKLWSYIFNNIDNYDGDYLEDCAIALVAEENEYTGDAYTTIPKIRGILKLDEVPEEQKESLEEFKYDILSKLLERNNNWVGWILDRSKELFPQPTVGNPSYLTDIIQEAYLVLLSNVNEPKFWEEAIRHYPDIVDFASKDFEKEKFVKYCPLELEYDLLARPEYAKFDHESFIAKHKWLFREKRKNLETFISNNSIIFDIEGDANTGVGWEYAYLRKQKLVSKPSENHRLSDKQWSILENAISESSVVVGHNIKEWDYKLLNKRNSKFHISDELIQKSWDTMQVEMLLYPFRSSYALDAVEGHIARNDVAATNDLFKLQLLAILYDESTFDRLKDYLPVSIVSQIEENRAIIYAANWDHEPLDNRNRYFYAPAKVSLPEFKVDRNKSLLIIAPREYWPAIFKEFDACFYSPDDGLNEFGILDINKIIDDYKESKSFDEYALYVLAKECKGQKVKLNINTIPPKIRFGISDKKLMYYVLDDDNSDIICMEPDNLVHYCSRESPDQFDQIALLLNDTQLPKAVAHMMSDDDVKELIISRGDYSVFKRYFDVDADKLPDVKEKITVRNLWFTQLEPGRFALNSDVSVSKVKKELKCKFPNATFVYCPSESEEHYDSAAQVQNENDEGYVVPDAAYWAKRLEKFKTYSSPLPKVLVLNTKKQALSASKYLLGADGEEGKCRYVEGIEIRKYFDKIQENKLTCLTVVLDDLRSNLSTDFGAPFLFVLNDTFCLTRTQNRTSINQALKQLEREVSAIGSGSQVVLLDELKEKNIYDPSEESIALACKYFIEEDEAVLTVEEEPDLLNWIRNAYEYTGFKSLQEPAIKKVIEYQGQHKNFLTILPTGGGKSVIFQGPIFYKAVKKKNHKLSIVITPLQALMEDQVAEARIVLKKNNLKESLVNFINANSTWRDKKRVISDIHNHKIALLYISPERLVDRHFFNDVVLGAALDQGIDSIIFDEAHCITAWGMDFRSDYVLALRKSLELQEKFKDITIQMFTATLPHQSREELKAEIQFGEDDCNILPEMGSELYKESLCPIREHINLSFERINADQKKESLELKLNQWLRYLEDYTKKNLLEGRSRMILFTYSRDDAEYSSGWIKKNLTDFEKTTDFFHAGISREAKDEKLRAYKNGDILILCATKAFGLGMNIPNIHYVFHLTPPTFIEDYLQEVGRAARDKEMYENAFPIKQTDEREHMHITARCFYTTFDMEDRLNRIQRVDWADIQTSFRLIKEYIKTYTGNSSQKTERFFLVPINLLSCYEQRENYDRNKRREPEEDFRQCLNWLADPHGLNRIELGFRSPDSYDLGFNPDSTGIAQGSRLFRLVNHIKTSHNYNNKRIIIRANEIISASLDIVSVNELEDVIDEGVRLGIFNRDYSYVKISLRRKQEISQAFLSGESDELERIDAICKLLAKRLEGDLDFSEYDNYTIRSWDFYLSLNTIYTIDEIKTNCIDLIRAIGNSNTESVSWKTMSEVIHAKNDPDKLKLFLTATYKIGYTTRGTKDNDFIEIKLLEERDLDDEKDKEAKKKITDFYQSKESRAGVMCGLVEEFSDSASDSTKEIKEIIREYSACPLEKLDDLSIVSRLNSRESLKKRVGTIESPGELNAEQLEIYNSSSNININVIAGAGSGKTRLLIYRALKMILDEGNKESRVLLLAYNRAVKDEVEKRMNEVSTSIGYTMRNPQIYTFHGFASYHIAQLQEENVDFGEWERELLNDMKEHSDKYRDKFQYVLIDEFQDVTTTRLESIKKLLELNPQAKAFVIGDMFQSIYGYEKKSDAKRLKEKKMEYIDSIEPVVYYKRLKEGSNFKEKTLHNNYRSYQSIIDTAQMWFKGMPPKYEKEYKFPHLISQLGKDKYSQDVDDKGCIPPMDGNDWKSDFEEKILQPFLSNRSDWSNSKGTEESNPFSIMGILFRSNSDVQDAYLWLKNQQFVSKNNIELKIQGSDIYYQSTREFYFFEKGLEEQGDKTASIEIIKEIHNNLAKADDMVFDDSVLNVARDLASRILEEETITCKRLNSKFKEVAQSERNRLKDYLGKEEIKDNRLRIVLSTIHRVKGLEYDAVVVPASICPIGFNNDDLTQEELNMEERRLMYVAFSRAKRMLFYYMGDRENAILQNKEYNGLRNRVYAKDSQSKVNIGALGLEKFFQENEYIRKNVKIDDEIIIHNGRIIHKKHTIGLLSKNNEIRDKSQNTDLTGFHIKSVNILTKEQNKLFEDKNNGKLRWCDEAEFVYYVDFYGFTDIT